MRPTRFYSKKQENEVAKAVSGRRTANSGATAFQKGDVLTDDWLIECKTSTKAKASFSIKKEWLQKNEEEAFQMGKHNHALCFDFGDDGERYYVVDESTFVKMMKGVSYGSEE